MKPLHRLARALMFAAGCLAAPAMAQDYRPSFQPDRLTDSPAGRPNEVLVLGTPHLDQLGPAFQPQMLEPLLSRLEAWRPTAIASEDVSGLQCDSLRRYPSRYAQTIRDYCPDPTLAGRLTGLDVPAANAEAERILADWPTEPTAAQRRRLAAVFLAAGEPYSALVQWLRLPAEERLAADGLDAELVRRLDRRKDHPNESTTIAAELAARLGLERVWSVDDHSADPIVPADPQAYGEAISRAWDNPASRARRTEDDRLVAGLAGPDGLMQMYRAHNGPEAPMRAYQSDFGPTLAEPSPEAHGRRYVGYWETRNLRMAANIRDVLARRPGERLLAIVGASHKGYYEAYLNQMRDVRLVDAAEVLR